jgi:hypothetical protein
VLVDGHDVRTDPDKVRAVIGLTGQAAAVDELLTGRENLVMMGRLYRLTAASAKVRPRSFSRSSISSRPPDGQPKPIPAVCAGGSTWRSA